MYFTSKIYFGYVIVLYMTLKNETNFIHILYSRNKLVFLSLGFYSFCLLKMLIFLPCDNKIWQKNIFQ
ncbi:hypothetical protein ACJX0J_035307, partial [Zea mays]